MATLRFSKEKDCYFCQKVVTLQPLKESPMQYFKDWQDCKQSLQKTMLHSLYEKYSSSQNYYYTRELNEILTSQRTKPTIDFRDQQCYDDDSEQCLNRFYGKDELSDKFTMLGEYYKFHNDIPRIFMLPAIISLNWYHDKKRRIEYFKISKQIEHDNNNNPDKPPKGIVGDSPVTVRDSENLTEPVYDDSSDIQEEVIISKSPYSQKVDLKKVQILNEISWLKPEKSQLPNKEEKNLQKFLQRQSQQPSLKLQLNKLKFMQASHQMKSIQPTKTTTDMQQTNQKTLQHHLNLNLAFKSNLNQLPGQKDSKQSTQPKSPSAMSIINRVSIENGKLQQKPQKWKKNLKLEDNHLKGQETIVEGTIETARNESMKNPSSDRQCKTTTNKQDSAPKKRKTSLSNILSIIKKQQHGHGRQMSKYSFQNSTRQENQIPTPRGYQNLLVNQPQKQQVAEKNKCKQHNCQSKIEKTVEKEIEISKVKDTEKNKNKNYYKCSEIEKQKEVGRSLKICPQSNPNLQISKGSFNNQLPEQQGRQQKINCGSKNQYSSLLGNVTPRSNFNGLPNTISAKNSPKQGQQIQFTQKVQMLELKVLTDLQSLQNKKSMQSKFKKHCTLYLDSVSSKNGDIKSLTHRVQGEHTDQDIKQPSQRQKQSLQEGNSFRNLLASCDIKRQYPSGTQSYRDKLGNIPTMEQYLLGQNSKNNNRFGHQVNTSAEQFKLSQMYYNNVPIAQISNPSQVSTFATQNQSSCQTSINNKNLQNELKISHQKTSSHAKLFRSSQQQKQQSQKVPGDIDSQLYNAALKLASKINNHVSKQQTFDQPMSSVRGNQNPVNIASLSSFRSIGDKRLPQSSENISKNRKVDIIKK